MELDPLSTVTQGNLARVLFYAGKLDEADSAARKAAELQPTGAGSHRFQVLIAAQRGDGEAALREAQLEPDPAFADSSWRWHITSEAIGRQPTPHSRT